MTTTRRNHLSVILTVLSATLFLFSCNTSSKEETSSQKPKIVCTTGMIADGIKNLVGDSCKVVALMGPGTDPHSYSAKPSDMQQLQTADIVVYNGLHLEGKMSDMFHKLSLQKPVIAVADGLQKPDLRKLDGEATDPHIWFNIQLWSKCIQYSSKELQKQLPQLSSFIAQNTIAYTERLSLLNQETLSKISSIPQEQRILVTAHDAFSYFGDAYQIEVKPLKGISTVSETSIKEINDLIDLIVERNIKAIFVESSVNPESIEMIAKTCRERQHTVIIGGTLFSDAMGAKNTPEGTYEGMVRANVNTIVNALK